VSKVLLAWSSSVGDGTTNDCERIAVFRTGRLVGGRFHFCKKIKGVFKKKKTIEAGFVFIGKHKMSNLAGRIPIKFQIYAQIVPTPNSDVHERISYECTLEQEEFLVDDIDVFRMPLSVIMRQQRRSGGKSISAYNMHAADRGQTDSENDTTSTGDNDGLKFQFSPISRHR
jgi:hypothetical protein